VVPSPCAGLPCRCQTVSSGGREIGREEHFRLSLIKELVQNKSMNRIQSREMFELW